MLMSKFKKADILENLYISLQLHRCIDRSNQLRFNRRAFFFRIFIIPMECVPYKFQRGEHMSHFIIEMGGAMLLG